MIKTFGLTIPTRYGNVIINAPWLGSGKESLDFGIRTLEDFYVGSWEEGSTIAESLKKINSEKNEKI